MQSATRRKPKIVETEEWITKKQAVKIAGEFGIHFPESAFDKFKHGHPVLQRRHDNGRVITYRLKKIFMQDFDLKYSCTQGRKSGKELIISSLELPDIRKFLALSSKEQQKLIGLKGQKTIPGIKSA